jgi:hypothetical protein
MLARTNLTGLFVGLWFSAAFVVPAEAQSELSFARDVRPILAKNCWACHGFDDEARKGGLRLDVREAALKPGDSGGAAIVPGKPDESDLIARVTSTDENEVMPPPSSGHSLTPEQIKVLRRWIESGADYTPHWAFVAPVRPQPPTVPGTAHPIDAFIRDRLAREGLQASPEGDRHQLIRRLSLDLRGLPPTPAEVAAFVADQSPDAWEKLVDRFLDDPAYGERLARMWLDLARYADSAGYGSDPLRLNIWPYRDWVIGAFNRNLSYDQFTLEQLAGDLLPNATDEQKIATAFHRNTMTNTEGGTDDEEFRSLAVKDRIDTTVQVWMGLTFGCAKCHNHKYDPIAQEEYYSFYAIFNQTADRDLGEETPTLPILTPAQREETRLLDEQIAALRTQLDVDTPELATARKTWEQSLLLSGDWQPLAVTKSEATGGSTFKTLDDGSLLVGGASPQNETYRLTTSLDLHGITALRLETIPDDSLPAKGAGRGADGNFVLSRFSVTAEEENNTRGVPTARFVRLELPGTQKFIHVAEVEVFSNGENIARKGKASQSSTDFGGNAERGIDGNTNGNYYEANTVTHTAIGDNPWWEVDLGNGLPVDKVTVWNRTDGGTQARMNGFRVLLLDANRQTVWTSEPVAEAPAKSLELSPSGKQTLEFAQAAASHSQGNFPVANALKQPNLAQSGWAVAPKISEPNWAVFALKETASAATPRKLTIQLEHLFNSGTYTLGRFRLLATKQTNIRQRLAVPTNILAIIDKPSAERTPAENDQLVAHYRTVAPALAPLRNQIAALEKKRPQPTPVPVMVELPAAEARKSFVMIKGNFLSPGNAVQPAFPKLFPAAMEGPLDRAAAARWLFAPENPLTARVAVNRLWALLFGQGLVETEEDFGTQGELPSHPELLDWLAIEFREPTLKIAGPTASVTGAQDRPWDIKRFLKLIVTSATYKQTSAVKPEHLEKDSRNRLFARAPRLRLDAETIRDQVLAHSGLLSRKVGGPSVYPYQPDGLWQAAFNGQRSWATSAGEDKYRRGLYTFWRRTVPYPSMATFDAPSRETCSIRRPRTNTPLQAFVTMNDPAYVEAAQALARRLVKEGGATPADRAKFGLELVLARPATTNQVAALTRLFEDEHSSFKNDSAGAVALATEPLGPLPEGMDPAELAAWTVVANVLLNLDGVLMK